MGILAKAIKHQSASNVQELGHNMSYNRIQDVFYAGQYGDDYENVYEYVRPLANRFSRIEPYAINSNGEKVENVPALNAIYRPNQQMSSTQFRDSLMTGIKTQQEIYILVWRKEGRQLFPGGQITPENIGGYTFLQGVSKINTFGQITYQTTNAKGQLLTFKPSEVITLSDSRNPANLSEGYSPLKAAKKWISVDDYIVAYQQGFFRNGAVPSGQFVITAASKQDFEDTVEKMREAHRGAGQNNNVVYTPRPVDPNTSKPAEAKVDWIPFSVQNKDMELGVLTENVNKRKESAFGVPGVIRGVDDSANYATAQVMKQSFVENNLEPSTHNIWTSWTHELNRITGGLGVAITYDLEIPQLSDEQKVDAERKRLEGEIIRNMATQGYTLESIVNAFQLPTSYKKLAKEQKQEETQTDKPDVDEGNEVIDTPDPRETSKSVKPEVKEVKKVETPQDKLEEAGREYMQAQVDRAVREYEGKSVKAVEPEPTESELNKFVIAMMAVITGLLLSSGDEEYAAGVALMTELGIPTNNLTRYNLTDTAIQGYRDYMVRVGESYGNDTAQAIRGVLARADEIGLNRTETEQALKQIMQTDDWRIKRLARTELNRSQAIASVESMKQIQAETGVPLEKSLYHPTGAECQWCKALEGVWVRVDEPLLGLGDSLVGVDGGILVNDFANNEGYDPHPNGTGVAIYRRAV